MAANKVTVSGGKELTGTFSDKEYGTGQTICQVIENKGLNNFVVFVRGRRYGGNNLGPKRYQTIK